RALRDGMRMRLLRAVLDRGRRPPRLLGQLSVTTTYLLAECEYRPARQLEEGDLVLFRATRGEGIDAPFIDFYEDPLFGWSSRSSRAVHVVDVPGGHTSMLREPNVDVLAQHMQAAMDESLARGGGDARSGAVRALG